MSFKNLERLLVSYILVLFCYHGLEETSRTKLLKGATSRLQCCHMVEADFHPGTILLAAFKLTLHAITFCGTGHKRGEACSAVFVPGLLIAYASSLQFVSRKVEMCLVLGICLICDLVV